MPPSSSGESPLFALLIGINEYKHRDHGPLRGCINDAQAVQSFLQLTLRVPSGNIATLFDHQATRRNILDKFESHLIENRNIRRGDAIVIFFAGHGGRVKAPRGWTTTDGEIEMIIPHDEGVTDRRGNLIPGIPDAVINGLLQRLSAEKGNNIVVILDCCHSGSGTRGDLVPRAVKNACPYTNPQQDMARFPLNVRQSWPFSPTKFTSSMASHVLLAACKKVEQAMESTREPAHGLFTHALICALTELSLNLEHISYTMLMECLPPIISQTPQLEGTSENKARTVFSGTVRPENRIPIFDVTVATRPRRKVTVSAGLIHGVKRGTEFTVWDYSPDLGPPRFVGEGVAERVDAVSCVINFGQVDDDFMVDIPQMAKARISNWNNNESILKVFVGTRLLEALEPTLRRVTEKHYFALVRRSEEAHLVLNYHRHRGKLVIIRLGWMAAYGTKTISVDLLPHEITDTLPLMLNHIAAFRYHLERQGGNIIDMARKVEMHFYRLTEHNPRQLDMEHGDLFVKGFPPDLPVSIWQQVVQSMRSPDNPGAFVLYHRRAFVPNNPDHRYGIKITNTSNYGLFPYLFYFNFSDYSIEKTYLPQSKTMDAPLRAADHRTPGYLNIGYGNGGDPLAFSSDADNGHDLDSGFYKLFVSDENLNMEHIAQGSIHDSGSTRLKQRRPKDVVKIWGTSMASISVYNSMYCNVL